MRCQICGTENGENAAFCKECGAKLSEVSKEADAPAQKKQGRAKIWVIGACAVICLCLIAGGSYVFVKSRQDQSAPSGKEEAAGESKSTAKEEEEAGESGTTAEEEGEQAAGVSKDAADEKEQGADDVQTERSHQAPVITMQNVTGAAASSELAESHTVHSAMRVMDGDKNTAWVEGVGGQGEGQFVQFSFRDIYLVSGVRIRAGYQKNDDIYYKNSRPREIEVIFSDGSGETFELQDKSQEEQVLNLAEPVETNSVRLMIKSVYPGGKYEDTCISEIAFF